MPEPTAQPTELHLGPANLGLNHNRDSFGVGWQGKQDFGETWIKMDHPFDTLPMFVRREGPSLEFFAYQEIGAALSFAIPERLLKASF